MKRATGTKLCIVGSPVRKVKSYPVDKVSKCVSLKLRCHKLKGWWSYGVGYILKINRVGDDASTFAVNIQDEG